MSGLGLLDVDGCGTAAGIRERVNHFFFGEEAPMALFTAASSGERDAATIGASVCDFGFKAPAFRTLEFRASHFESPTGRSAAASSSAH